MASARRKRAEPGGRLGASRRAVVSLLGAADRLRRRFAELIEPHGITFQQYNVLRILRGAGDEGLPTMEVRRRMIEQAPGITRLVDRLAAKGFVERRPAPRDRRETLCRITPRGRALLRRLDGIVDEVDLDSFAPLSAAKIEGLVGSLQRVRRRE